MSQKTSNVSLISGNNKHNLCIENRKAVQKMKRDIGQCKGLLHCNREEFRRLWLELVEQRRSLELIEVIDRVRTAPEILKNLISAKAWPEATEYLLKVTEVLLKEVEHVPALDTVKGELALRKKVRILFTSLFSLADLSGRDAGYPLLPNIQPTNCSCYQ